MKQLLNIDKGKLRETILLAAAAAVTSVLITKLAKWLTDRKVDEAREEDTSTLN